MNIIIAILIFGIIIIVHEFGHFLIAKKNGIQVDEFCIGLGPTIIGKQVGDTFYSIKLLPFGGASIVRDGEEKNIEVTPMYNKERSQYMIGITWSGYQKVNPLKTLEYSFREVGLQVKITLKSVKMLVSQKLGVKDLSGPVGIVKTVGDQYTQAAAYGLKTVFLTMANWIILISANLGVMNLLPLPALDGGRLLFLIIEAITGKAVPQNMEALVHTAGLILLMLLMVIVMYQDIVKIFM